MNKSKWLLMGIVAGVFQVFNLIADNVGDTPPKPDKPPCKKCQEDCPDKTCADPFYLHSGEFFWEKSLLSAPDSMLGLDLRYSTFSDTEGVLGAGWTHSFQYHVLPTDDGGYAVRGPQRKTIYFELVSTNNYRAKDNSQDTLQLQGGGVSVMRTVSKMEYWFDADGKLTKIVDPIKGRQLVMTYDPAGQLPVMGIPKASQLSQAVVTVRDWRFTQVAEQTLNGTATGRALGFNYDATGHLWKVEEVGGTRNIIITYQTPSGQLMGLTDELGEGYNFTYYDDPAVRDDPQQTIFWRYMKTFQGQGCADCVVRTNYYTTASVAGYGEQRGKLNRQTQGANAEGEEILVTYNGSYSTTVNYKTKNTETGALLRQRWEIVVFVSDVFGESRVQSRTVRSGSANGPIIYQVAYTYNPTNGRMATQTLENGSVITYNTYDANGNITKETRTVASGKNLVTDRVFDANSNLKKEDIYFSNATGTVFTTEWDYDAAGRMTAEKKKKADGTYVTTGYSYFTSGVNTGLLQTKTDPRGNAMTYEYTSGATEPKGLVKRIYDPANPSRQTTFTYDAWGNKRFVVDALNRTTEYQYDARNRVTKIIYPDTSEEIRTYVGGNLIESKTGKASPGYRFTRFQYNGLNQQIRVKRVNDQGNEVMQREMDYDSENNVIAERNALGQATLYSYDEAGRRTSVKEPKASGGLAETQLFYDAGGRLIKQIDPLGNITEMAYDLLDRQTLLTEAKGQAEERQTGHVYDAAGNEVTTQYLPGTATTNYYYERTGWCTGINYNATPDAAGLRQLPKKMEYDGNGNVTAEIDGRGNRTEFVYNAYNELTTIKYADRASYTGGNDTVYTYDLVGNRLSQADGRGDKRYFNYDAMNRVTHESVPTTGTLTGTWWTTAANVLQSTSYNLWGQPTSTASLAGGTTGATYDAFGRPSTQTNEAGLTVAMLYDALDNVKEQQYPLVPGNASATKVVYAYNTNNGRLLASVTDRAGNPTTFGYDDAGRQTEVTTSLNAKTTTVFDGLGRTKSQTVTVTGSSDPSTTQTTSYTYSRFDDVLTITYPDHVAGTNDRIQTLTYNNYGLVLTQGGAGTYPLEYTYDLAGNRETLKTKYGSASTFATTTWNYDNRNRVWKKIYPDSSYYQYSYDAAGNLLTRRDGKAVTTTYGYNAFNLLTTIDYPTDPDVTFGYDTSGRRTSMTDASGVTEWTYDTANRVATYKQNAVDRKITYGYFGEGGRTSMSVDRISNPGSPWTTIYNYDAVGRLKMVQDAQTGTFTYFWQPSANLFTEILMPGGAKQTKTYDGLARLKEIKALNNGGSVVNSFSYNYTKANLREQVTLQPENSQIDYEYDAVRQLTFASKDTNPNYNYDYSFDNIGNWLTGKTGNIEAAPTNKTFTPNALNQYSNVSGAVYTYDLNGNLLGGYGWDQENRLISAGGTTFGYDGMSRRVKTGTTIKYLYDGLLPVAELDASNNITRYVTRGLDLSNTLEGAGGIGGILATKAGASGGNYFYDGNGNVVHVLDAASNVIAHYQYDPFGNKVSESGSYVTQPYQWSTKEYHASTGSVYYLWRFYSPSIGRWLSRDPITEKGGINLYKFVSNNPINSVDAYGLFDFYHHYRNGGGDITLSQVGLASAFENAITVKMAVESFNWMLEGKAKKAARGACPSKSSGNQIAFFKVNAKEGRTGTDVTKEPGLFEVGNSTFFREANGTVAVDCCLETYTAVANSRFYIRDMFIDPYDTRELFGIVVENGAPYRIDHDFSKSWSSSGSL